MALVIRAGGRDFWLGRDAFCAWCSSASTPGGGGARLRGLLGELPEADPVDGITRVSPEALAEADADGFAEVLRYLQEPSGYALPARAAADPDYRARVLGALAFFLGAAPPTPAAATPGGSIRNPSTSDTTDCLRMISHLACYAMVRYALSLGIRANLLGPIDARTLERFLAWENRDYLLGSLILMQRGSEDCQHALKLMATAIAAYPEPWRTIRLDLIMGDQGGRW
jgi:hypothetical protein